VLITGLRSWMKWMLIMVSLE